MHPGACCYANSPSCGMPGSGRALRSVDGSVAPPRPPRRESRSARPLPALATHWADVAAHEHASVSAFARTARELAALGAPHELVDRTKRAARDEVRHARVAFAIASAHAGERLAPSPRRRLPARPPTHETIAEEALVDGCFAETIGAVLLVATAERIDDDATREAVTRIAEDEMRHAELSFATLAWAVARGVELPEKRALSIVLEDTPYLSRVEAERIARAVVDELVRPCLERLRRQ